MIANPNQILARKGSAWNALTDPDTALNEQVEAAVTLIVLDFEASFSVAEALGRSSVHPTFAEYASGWTYSRMRLRRLPTPVAEAVAVKFPPTELRGLEVNITIWSPPDPSRLEPDRSEHPAMTTPPIPSPPDPDLSEAERWNRLLKAELEVLRSHLAVLRRQHSELGVTIEETERAIANLMVAIEHGDQ